jgi:hypothetical protein
MALIIYGKTICQMCNKTLEKNDELKAYPAFLPYDHRFGKFSDAAFHKACAEADPDFQGVEDMFFVYKKIMDSRPRDLKSIEEIEAWGKEAFQDWPPKNGVIIYEQCFPEDGQEAEWFWADKDSWEQFEKAEAEANREMEERREEARKREREAWRYARDDDY